MKVHIKSSHIDENNNFECRQCMKLFPTKVALEAHTESDHQKISNASKYDFPCTFCDKEFPEFAHLIAHMKRFHDLDSANEHLNTIKDWKEIYPEIVNLIKP